MVCVVNKYCVIYACVTIICLIWVFQVLSYLNVYPTAVEDLAINQLLHPIKAHRIPYSPPFSSAAGMHAMKESSVAIFGVGRNIESTALSFLKQVDQLTAHFQWSQVTFVAGDSTDKTMYILNRWAGSGSNRSILTIDLMNMKERDGVFVGRDLPREGRIAFARNAALRDLRLKPRTDFVINIDMDVLGWNPYGVLDSFSKVSHWDVVCSNGVILYGLYRDIYAVRAPGINTNHHLCGTDHLTYNISYAEKQNNRRIQVDSKRKVHRIMESGMYRQRSRDLDLVKLDSCFGGLAIYKSPAIEHCEYAYRYTEPPYMLDCEHVLFSKCAMEKNAARIVTNMNMKLWYGHTSLAAGVDWMKFYNSLVVHE